MVSIGYRIHFVGLMLLVALSFLGCGGDGQEFSEAPRSRRVNQAVPLKLQIVAPDGSLVNTAGEKVAGSTTNTPGVVLLDAGVPTQFQTGFAPPNTVATSLGTPPVGHLPYDSETLSATRNEPDFFEWSDLRFVSLPRQTTPVGGTGSSYLGFHELTMNVETPTAIEKIVIEDRLGQPTEFTMPITITARVTRTIEQSTSEFLINGIPFDISFDLLSGIVLEVPAVLGEYRVTSRSLYEPSDDSPAEDNTYEATIPVRALEFAQPFAPITVEPQQDIEISNTFLWNTGDTVEDPRWKVTISDVFGRDIGTFEDTGQLINVVVPRSDNVLSSTLETPNQELVLVPEGCGLAEQVRQQALQRQLTTETSAEEKLFLFYQVTVSGVALNTPDVYRYYLHSSQRAIPALRIANLSVSPNPFFPDSPSVPEEERATTEIYAELETEGVDDGVTYEIHIMSQDGELLKTIESEEAGFEILEYWDGLDDEGNPIQPQLLKIEVTAQTCRISAAQPQANVSVATQNSDQVCISTKRARELDLGGVGPTPVLEAFSRSGSGRLLIGSSEALDLDDSTLNKLLGQLTTDGKISLFLRDAPQGQNSFSGEIVAPNGVKVPVQLLRSGENAKVDVDLPMSVLSSSQNTYVVIDGGELTGAFQGDPDSETSDIVKSLVEALPSTSSFPSPRSNRGRIVRRRPQNRFSEEFSEFVSGVQALTSEPLVKSTGFEKLGVSVAYRDNRGTLRRLDADFKLENPSEFVHWRGPSLGAVLFVPGSSSAPAAMSLRNSKTVVLSGCDALSIHNYDLPYILVPAGADATHGISWSSARPEGSVFLGYRNFPPAQPVYNRIITKFFEEVVRLDNSLPSSERVNALRWAWLNANFSEWTGGMACVLDDGGFHYIHGMLRYDSRGGRRNFRRNKFFVTISRADFNKPRPNVDANSDGIPDVPSFRAAQVSPRRF